MKRTITLKILHLSRETLHDMASSLTGGVYSVSACPRNKVCDSVEVSVTCVHC